MRSEHIDTVSNESHTGAFQMCPDFKALLLQLQVEILPTLKGLVISQWHYRELEKKKKAPGGRRLVGEN